MLLSRHQNTVQNNDMKTANRSFENVAQFKYLGTTVTIVTTIVRNKNTTLLYNSVILLLEIDTEYNPIVLDCDLN
jgi:hypothetical protein